MHVPTINKGRVGSRPRPRRVASYMTAHQERSNAEGGITDRRHAPVNPINHRLHGSFRITIAFYALATRRGELKPLRKDLFYPALIFIAF